MTIATRQWLFTGFKVSVYTLLVINIFLYLRHGTLNEAMIISPTYWSLPPRL